MIVVTPYLVKPVNERDIIYPTDGFRASTEAEQLLLYKESGGVSGERRPGPTASEPDAPNPEVSAVDPAAIVPSRPSSQDRRADNKRNRKRDGADAPAPGFSL